MNRIPTVKTVLYSCAALLVLTACGGSPEDKVARLRGMYAARLNGFLVQAPPAPEPAIPAEEGAEPSAPPVTPTPPAEGADEMAEPMAIEPANPDIMLDILIQHDSPTILPGVTVDITHVDADKNEKGSWKVWFDTSTVKKANVTQYTHVLEDVPYVEGDGFFAEVRHPVPAEERSQYRELSGSQ